MSKYNIQRGGALALLYSASGWAKTRYLCRVKGSLIVFANATFFFFFRPVPESSMISRPHQRKTGQVIVSTCQRGLCVTPARYEIDTTNRKACSWAEYPPRRGNTLPACSSLHHWGNWGGFVSRCRYQVGPYSTVLVGARDNSVSYCKLRVRPLRQGLLSTPASALPRRDDRLALL